jgi:hypothetical protein
MDSTTSALHSLDRLLGVSLAALSAILTLAFFLLVAYLSRATARRVAGAIAVAALVAPMVLAVDLAASSAKLWRYLGVATAYAPIGFYLASGLGIGAVSLVVWRLARRFGPRVNAMTIAFFALYGPARDYLASRLAPSMIEFSPGAAPLLADMLAWASGISLALFAMRLVAGPAGADPLARVSAQK